jgi:ribbon-helix-helix protein, copG family
MSAIKTKNLTIRVSEDFAKILKEYAKKRYMSQSNLIEYLVKKEMESENKK